MTLTLNIFINSIRCLHLPNFRSQAAIVSENTLFSICPIEKPMLQNLTLPLIGQCQHRVIILTNYNGPITPMLHTKFHGNRPNGSGDEDFGSVLPFLCVAVILVM